MLRYALRGHNIYVSAHQKHFDRIINYDTAASDSFRQGSSQISDPWADFRVKYDRKVVKSNQLFVAVIIIIYYLQCTVLLGDQMLSLNPPPGISCPLKANYSIALCSPKTGDDQKV